jgi:hypothetical protein
MTPPLSRKHLCMYCRVNAFNYHSDDTRNLVTELLSSNGRLLWFQYSGFQAARRHIAPSLRLFILNSLMVYHHSFSSEGSARDIFLWLGFFFARYQPIPLLPPYVPSSRASPDTVLSILSIVVGAGASTLLAPPLCAFFFDLEGADCSTMSHEPLLTPNVKC